MNIDALREISRRLNIKDVARYLGIDVNRAGFILCPFHSERTASCKLYDNGRFWCFGCQTGGDGIDLVAAVKSISKAEAAAELNGYFNLGVDLGRQAKRIRRKKPNTQQVDAEQIKAMVDDVADLHRYLLRRGVPLSALGDNIEAFHQRLLDDDALRLSAPEVFYRKHRKEFIKYGNTERRYHAIRVAVERSRGNGQPYQWDEILSILGRTDTISGSPKGAYRP